MEIISKHLHHVDNKLDSPTEIDILGADSKALIEFLNSIVTDTTTEERVRTYNLPEEETTLKTVLQQIGDHGILDETSYELPSRLLRAQREQDRLSGHLNEIKKGSILQIVAEDQGERFLIVTKIEDAHILDLRDFVKRAGLPYEQQIQKTCLIYYERDIGDEFIYLSDSNGSVSYFWWNRFLELLPARSDRTNTRQAFAAMDTLISQYVKPKFPEDHTYLRNDLIAFFRMNSSFDFEEMVESVFASYEPINEGLDKDKLKSRVEKAKIKGKFDQVFNIDRAEIRAKFKRVIALTDKIELKLLQDVEFLRSTIIAFEEKDKKYIKIESEHGFRIFAKQSPGIS